MNELPPVVTPPPLPRKSSFFRRALFILIVGLGGLIVFAAAVWFGESWRGQRGWEKYQREATARGEKLEWRAYIPAPVAEEQNFAANPLLKPLFAVEFSTSGAKRKPVSPELRRVLLVDATAGAGKNRPSPRLGNVDRNDLTDLKAWQKFYRGNKEFPQPPSGQSPAADVLLALGKFNAELGELQQAAARPHNRSLTAYPEEMAEPPFLSHAAQFKTLINVLGLRATARLELGQAAEALADVKLGLRLADTLQDEPTLFGHLLRLANEKIALQGLREGLARHAWSDAQLAELEKTLAPVDLLREHVHVLRGERALSLAVWDAWRRGQWPRATAEEAGETAPGAEAMQGRAMPGPLYHQSKLALCRMYDTYALPAVDEKNRRVLPAALESFAQKESRNSFYAALARLTFSSVPKTSLQAARAQVAVDHARLAAALERHRLANGQFPDTLAALAPRFLEKLPSDLLSGAAMKYRREADGGYVLYSVGWNEADDNGETAMTPSNPPRPDPNRGDWVWKGK